MNRIIIHCSATPNGRPHTAEEIHRWHLAREWSGIGYHWVIRTDGVLEAGRPEYWKGSHVKGQNTGSVGICLIGTDEFSEAQWYTLTRLVNELSTRYPHATIHGHNEFSSKSCPGFNVKEWWENVRTS